MLAVNASARAGQALRDLARVVVETVAHTHHIHEEGKAFVRALRHGSE